MFLGEIIKSYRDEHGLSMQDFASLSKLSKPYISQLEKKQKSEDRRRYRPLPGHISKSRYCYGNRIHFDPYRQLLEVIKNPYFPMVCGGSSNC